MTQHTGNIPIDERAVNHKSDELQMGIMNCIKCGKIYRGNIVSAICPDCRDKVKLDRTPTWCPTCQTYPPANQPCKAALNKVEGKRSE